MLKFLKFMTKVYLQNAIKRNDVYENLTFTKEYKAFITNLLYHT